MSITGKLLVVEGELGELIDLDQRYFPNPWTQKQWQDLNLSHHLVLKWQGQEELLGFALFQIIPGDDTAHLYKILVRPDLQGQGVSGKFWAAIVEKLRTLAQNQVYLEVESTNGRAVAFYKKIGFTCLRQVKGYYSNGSDGLMLQLTL